MLVAGRAMTVLEADVLDAGKEKGMNPVLKRSFGLMLEALDDLKEGEVYVCSGSSPADRRRSKGNPMPKFPSCHGNIR